MRLNNTYENNKELNIDKLFDKTMIKIAENGNYVEVYLALDMLDLHLEYEKTTEAAFEMNNPEMFDAFRKSIHIHSLEFENEKDRFRGKLYKNGLMGYILELNEKTIKYKGKSII